MYVDLLCPDSRDNHAVWKQLMNEESPIPGRKYSDIVHMRVVATVLPYHMHSWNIAKGISYLEHVCYREEGNVCVMDEYAELSWQHIDQLAHNTSLSEDDFTKH